MSALSCSTLVTDETSTLLPGPPAAAAVVAAPVVVVLGVVLVKLAVVAALEFVDAVVLAHGVLPGNAEAGPMVKECHRVLKTGGHFILTVEFRKRFGLASALNQQRLVSGAGGCYNEADIFQLLKDGAWTPVELVLKDPESIYK